jgi:hypothetical protein
MRLQVRATATNSVSGLFPEDDVFPVRATRQLGQVSAGDSYKYSVPSLLTEVSTERSCKSPIHDVLVQANIEAENEHFA